VESALFRCPNAIKALGERHTSNTQNKKKKALGERHTSNTQNKKKRFASACKSHQTIVSDRAFQQSIFFLDFLEEERSYISHATMASLSLVVDGECFVLPLAGVADQCGMFSFIDVNDLADGAHVPMPRNLCSASVFRLLVDYLILRASAGVPPRPIPVPLHALEFSAVADEIDVLFMESVATPPPLEATRGCSGPPSHQPADRQEVSHFRAAAHRVMELLSLAAHVQHNHLRQLCAAWVVCAACGASEACTRERFGLLPLDLDQRQGILNELSFFLQ
jgi:hypothetical protein